MNGEEDFHPNEDEEEEEEEPGSNQGSDFAFLLDAHDEHEGETSAEKAAREEREAEEARRKAEERRTPAPSLDQQTLEILADLKKNPEALRRVLTTQPTAPIAQPTDQAEPPVDIAALTTELEQDFLVDPKKAFAKLIGIGQKYMAEQKRQTERSVSAAGMGVAEATIESYLDKVRADTSLDPDVITEMEAMVADARRSNPDGIARSTPAQIRQALELSKATAVGKVFLKKGPPKPVVRSQRAPTYGSRGAAAGNRTPTRDDLPKNEAERSLVMGLREGGCSPKEIVASLREFRADQGGPRTNRRAG